MEQKLKYANLEEKKKIKEKINHLEGEIQRVLKKTSGLPPPDFSANPIPCYFNSGCCGYTNGLTALEIESEEIRLIKWEKENYYRRILQAGNLKEIISQTTARGEGREETSRPASIYSQEGGKWIHYQF